MTVTEFLILLLVAGICGGLAQAVAGFTRGGCFVSIALGLVGALLGTWLARLLGVSEMLSVQIGDQPFPIVWSIVGAALFVTALRLVSRAPRP